MLPGSNQCGKLDDRSNHSDFLKDQRANLKHNDLKRVITPRTSPSKEPTPETEIYVETSPVIVDPKPATSGTVLHPDSERHVDIWTSWIPPTAPPSESKIHPKMSLPKCGKFDFFLCNSGERTTNSGFGY